MEATGWKLESLFQAAFGLGLLIFEAVVNDTSVCSAKGSAEKSPDSGPDLESLNQVVPLKPQGLLKILPCGSGSHSHNG